MFNLDFIKSSKHKWSRLVFGWFLVEILATLLDIISVVGYGFSQSLQACAGLYLKIGHVYLFATLPHSVFIIIFPFHSVLYNLCSLNRVVN
jgi:hypothetical protein